MFPYIWRVIEVLIMNIEDKVRLSKEAVLSNKFIGIKEGMFVRFYNESLFVWQQWAVLNQALPSLKIIAKTIKKMNNQWIFYGGLPVSILENEGVCLNKDGIVSIDFDIDMRGYLQWCEKRKPSLIAINKKMDVDFTEPYYIRVFLPVDVASKIKDITIDLTTEEGLLLEKINQCMSFK